MDFADQADLTKAEIEEGNNLAPRFDANGLVTVVTIQAGSNTPLMLAHMNAEALALTLKTGVMHYFSRARGRIWKKGETSGELQKLVELRPDCDQDAFIAIVEQTGRGAACHTGRKSCFYRRVVVSGDYARLVSTGDKPLFDPKVVYGEKG